MWGSSAKDRLAAFQSKAEAPTVKKSGQGPRKIGKLNIPGQETKKEPAKPAPKKKVVKKKEPKPDMDETTVTLPGGDTEKVTPEAEPKVEAEAIENEASKAAEVPSDAVSALKDVDLDLSVELEANIEASSPEVIHVVPEVQEVPELSPKPAEPVEAKTTVVAGIPPPGSAPTAIEPQPAEPVEATTTTVAGIAPADTVQPALAPQPIGPVEPKTTTVAGILPAGAEAQPEVVPPKSIQVEAETMVVAGIPPEGADKAVLQPPSVEQAPAPVEQPVPPTSIGPVEGVTTVVAGIAPGSAKQQPEQPAETKPVQPAPKPEKPAQPPAQPQVKPPVQPPAQPPAQPPKSAVQAAPAENPGPKPAQPKKPEVAPAQPKKPERVPAQPKNPEGKPAEPEKPKEVRKRPPQQPYKKPFQPIPEEFFDNLFYFSGMGTVVGSALSKGVYVPKRNTSTALDVELIESYEAKKDEEIAKGVRVVKRARNEAEELADELRKLQALLSGLPTFGADSTSTQAFPQRAPPPPPFAPVSVPRGADMPGLDLIAKKVESVAKDIPAPPKAPPPAPKPIKSAFTPVTQTPAPPVDHRVPPITGASSNVGVFKGMVNGPDPKMQQSWQERYAGKEVQDAHAPKPFPGGDIPSGLKPWELSRLRGLEARGYEFTHEHPQSGADYSDDFYHGGSHMTGSEAPADDIASYAPYLVSTRSKKEDRAHLLQHEAVSSSSFRPAHTMTSPVPAAPLPYCDL